MITFNEQNKIFRLDTPATSYAMGIVEGGYLGHLYYGPRIGGTDLEQLYRLDAAALPSVWPGQKGGFMNVFPMEFPAAGRGGHTPFHCRRLRRSGRRDCRSGRRIHPRRY